MVCERLVHLAGSLLIPSGTAGKRGRETDWDRLGPTGTDGARRVTKRCTRDWQVLQGSRVRDPGSGPEGYRSPRLG